MADSPSLESPRALATLGSPRETNDIPRRSFFQSILSPNGDDGASNAPSVDHDLNLDRVIAAIVAGRGEYDLEPFYRRRLTDPDSITYRQDVMREVENPSVRRAVRAFADRMRTVRQRLDAGRNGHYVIEQQRWFLAAVEAHGDTVDGLAHDLNSLDLISGGLQGFRNWLVDYVASATYRALTREARQLAEALDKIQYAVLIHEDTVTVRPYSGERDESAAVEATFLKFRQGAVKDYGRTLKQRWSMNHVEAQIVDRVALLNPEVFGALARFPKEHANFLDATIARFDREIQFYVAYLDHIDRLRAAGLPFCYPQLSGDPRSLVARETFDLALADALIRQGKRVVRNDVWFDSHERILVITGPNQGGKTTLARAVGQVFHLAALGCPIPGREARLPICDRILTHFEREENVATLRGKLEDDLIRIHSMLEEATADSILIINEIFSSTTLDDAVLLGRAVLDRIRRLNALCVCVTFLDELAGIGESVVSIVAGVDSRDPSTRTFTIERRGADGLAYALAIAEKHRVTRRWLEQRIRS